MFQRCLFLAANMADDAMRLATTALDGLSDADAGRRDANLAAAPPPRRRRRSPSCTIRARDPAFVRTTRRWTPFRLLLPPLKNACPFCGWREKGGEGGNGERCGVDESCGRFLSDYISGNPPLKEFLCEIQPLRRI